MDKALIKTDIQNKVFNIRGINVMLERDLDALYGVEARVMGFAPNADKRICLRQKIYF